MSKSELLKDVRSRLLAFDKDGIQTAVKKALADGASPPEVVDELREGLKEIGVKYESGEYFLSELLISGETAKAALSVLTPHFAKSHQKHGKIVIGTVEGDIHDIGKNIVSTILLSSGFEVYDMGVDVKPSTFITKIKETGADILALSALLTSTMMNMRTVIDELKRMGLKEKVKVIVGGQPLTEGFAREIGADAYVDEAPKVLKAIENLRGG
ncbi:MAG: corrinoid protein [Candidatus Bathyarchaeia archaeon]